MALENRSYQSGSFTLELERNGVMTQCGFLRTIDGGHFKSEPVKYLDGLSHRATVFPGRPKFDDLTVTMGIVFAPPLMDWLKASTQGKQERRDGAIVAYDYSGNEIMRREFTNAILSELQLPALDASSKNNATIQMKIAPETLKLTKGDGKTKMKRQDFPIESKQHKWIQSNFSIKIDRFKNAQTLQRVTKIDALTLKQNIINNFNGRELVPFREFGRTEVPNLVITVPELDAEELWQWYDETVLQGNHGKPATGSITYLGTNMKDELMSVKFDGVQILSIENEKLEGNNDKLQRIKVTLAVEALELESKGDNGGGGGKK